MDQGSETEGAVAGGVVGARPPAPATAEPVRRGDGLPRLADWVWSILLRVHLGTRRPENWLMLVQFGIVGGVGYLVNLAVFAVLTQSLDIHHIAAAAGAFCVAVSNNFFWNRIWTFKDSAAGGHPGFQAARFFTVSLIGLAINLAVLTILVDWVGLAELPGQAIAVAVAMPANFIGNKMWTFGRP